MFWDVIVALVAFVWVMILFLPWRPWGTREFLDSNPDSSTDNLSDVTALIPARNEAEVLGNNLQSLQSQGRHLSIVLVDDQSTDWTVAVAQALGGRNLRILSGKPLPPDWTGKLWALDQGIQHVDTPLTLLIDADIELDPGVLSALCQKLRKDCLHLVSLMAEMRMTRFWERLLMPAFVYFFKMLYPFHLSNSPFSGVAAAAGGCILLETGLLKEMGGFGSIRNELIDDCALAKQIKSRGYRTWIGLTRSVHSLRSYDRLREIWKMVARSAFCQLRYSPSLLVVTTVGMIFLFWLPFAGLFSDAISMKIMGAAAFGAMTLSYMPILKYYEKSRVWALAFPLVATLYLAMTWSSAFRHWTGAGSEWKERFYGPTQET